MDSRWTREDDRGSLRELADWLNERLLEAPLSEAGVQTVDGEVTNYYRLLTDDGGIDTGEFRVFTDTRVYCEGCNTQYDIEDLPRNGGCECTD